MPEQTFSSQELSRFTKWELGIAAALALLILLVWVPKYQISQDWNQGLIEPEAVPQRVDQYRRTLAQIIGGVAILAGLYFAYRRLQATEQTVKVAEEGQITERFTRAIEQLGDKKRLAVRLGGIYALERIARDSEKDHGIVMEVLAAFLRETSPARGLGSKVLRNRVPTDVQATFTVIGRRNTDYERAESRIDLNQVDLCKADLIKADLSGAMLAMADLREAALAQADLSGAVLFKADLSEAVLLEADLSKAFLKEATYEIKQLAQAKSIRGIQGLSDQEWAELKALRSGSSKANS